MLSPYYWVLNPEQAESFDPQLRKATTLMKLVSQGLKPLFSESRNGHPTRPMQVFFGSLHGEIDPTLEFLKSYARKAWARPFLFQNSLHHSTTGFVSQQFELLGPCFSVCGIRNAQKEIIQVALLHCLHDTRATLLIHGESFPQELAEISKYEKQTDCEILYLDEKTVERIRSNVDLYQVLFHKNSFKEFFALLKEGVSDVAQTPS